MSLQRSNNTHTGFVAHYESGSQKLELDYFINREGERKATNWYEVNLEKLQTLELLWHGESKVRVSKEDIPGINPEDWYFTCSGTADIANPDKPIIIARNIGYRKGKILFLFTVEEDTGNVRTHTRS